MNSAVPATDLAKASPVLILIQGNEQKNVIVDKFPFTIGRKTENCLVISDPSVSREHAWLLYENGEYFVVDQGSKHGTFVNSERVERHQLKANDKIQFGANPEHYAIFNPTSSPSRSDFLSQLSTWKPKSATSDLEQLTLFLEVARKLTSSNVLEDVLATLIDATLRVTGAERGYIFLVQPDGSLKMACGRSAKGQPLSDDSTLSHSVLREAAEGSDEFLVTDTQSHEKFAARQSIVAHNLRSIICIPLRSRQITDKVTEIGDGKKPQVRGVLYLDSRYLARDLTGVSHDILTAIANDAASVVENAYLVQAEEKARRYQQELAIAARIQQRLITVKIPDCPYARIVARSIACKDVGGDFFDVVPTEQGLYFVVADVCGKGITAALLASILQGMTYSHFVQKTPLEQIVKSANRFLCEKQLEEKYATLIIARISPDGVLEIVNCGHVPPLLVRGSNVNEIENGNMPVGLFDFATYSSTQIRLEHGDRLLLVSDGVTEAEGPDGEFFGVERLKAAALAEGEESVFTAVMKYAGDIPLGDDCSVFELTFTGDHVPKCSDPTLATA